MCTLGCACRATQGWESHRPDFPCAVERSPSVGELYGFISQNMPQNDPGSLPQDDDLAVVAYLLQVNGMPPGSTPLPADTIALARDIIDVKPATR